MAKARRAAAPEPEPVVEAPPPPPATVLHPKPSRRDSNGWWTRPAPVPASEPAVADQAAATAELEALLARSVGRARERTIYVGDRPGREVTREYRERIIEPLIEQGWTYRRTNSNGKGKPRMISPSGETYALANTPSDWRGLKNAQSFLRRLGAEL